ncbi:MAG TPA: PIN domain nuclease, partial [Blastocatellia bacterium]|nr:PIN domain nuclease [Blastocatellia bacterium]
DNARRLIGKNVDMVVTSVLQTTAGKMIFGRVEDQKPEVRDARGDYRDRQSRPLPAPAPSVD